MGKRERWDRGGKEGVGEKGRRREERKGEM